VKLLWYVGIGAAVGGMSRYLLAAFVQARAGADFPAGTLLINITGSFLLGFIMRYALQTAMISPELRVTLTTGFCGGYTTFSTFSYETALLLEDGEYGRAALYVGSSVAIALLFTFLGFAAAQRLLAIRESVS
jgi:CrcB protein